MTRGFERGSLPTERMIFPAAPSARRADTAKVRTADHGDDRFALPPLSSPGDRRHSKPGPASSSGPIALAPIAWRSAFPAEAYTVSTRRSSRVS